MLQIAEDRNFFVDEALSHIGFIMDGNGRWAQKRGKPREYGHVVGVKTFESIVRYCKEIGIRHVTVYAFSTENWKRPEAEVAKIMSLFQEYLDRAKRIADENDMRVLFLGDPSGFPEKTREKMAKVEAETAEHSYYLNIAVNYGGRAEIVRAANRAIREGAKELTEADIERNLDSRRSPMPDLIVRTGGEYRLSNFLLWQSAYSELYFCETLWPDMKAEDVRAAVRAFYKRNRRYGGV